MTLSQQETHSIVYQTAAVVIIAHMFMFMWASCFAKLGRSLENQNIEGYDSDCSEINYYNSDSDSD